MLFKETLFSYAVYSVIYMSFLYFLLGMDLLKQAIEERVDQMMGSRLTSEQRKMIEEASTMELFKRVFGIDKVIYVFIENHMNKPD